MLSGVLQPFSCSGSAAPWVARWTICLSFATTNSIAPVPLPLSVCCHSFLLFIPLFDITTWSSPQAPSLYLSLSLLTLFRNKTSEGVKLCVSMRRVERKMLTSVTPYCLPKKIKGWKWPRGMKINYMSIFLSRPSVSLSFFLACFHFPSPYIASPLPIYVFHWPNSIVLNIKK